MLTTLCANDKILTIKRLGYREMVITLGVYTDLWITEADNGIIRRL